MLAKTLMILLVITVSAQSATAQSTFGDIVGVVKDQNQDAVPNAQIVLTSVDDGSQHQTTSDADGAFHFVNLKAGNYGLVATAAGFADFKVSSVHLDARQTLRLDVAMKLASASQSIEVAASAGPMMNTEDATIADSKDFQQITSLPVNYRGTTTSPLAMLATVPGAQQDANGNVPLAGDFPRKCSIPSMALRR